MIKGGGWITKTVVPKTAVIPLEQSLGRICEPVVKTGDSLDIGDVIAMGREKGTPPIHSSVSGTVKEIAGHPHPYGHRQTSIFIESDGMDKWTDKRIEGDLKDVIFKSGIVETYRLGGSLLYDKADTVILNGTDQSPYVFVDRSILREERAEVIRGLRILMEAVGAKKGIIGIDAADINLIESVRYGIQGDDIEVVPLGMVYTRGMGRLLSRDVSRRLKVDLKRTLVSRIPTARAVYQAVEKGRPFVETHVSVYGASEKGTVKARIGTPFRDIIEALGGYRRTPRRIVMNSPMTGVSLYSDEVSTIRATYALMVQYDASIEEPGPCIRCAKCVDVCPVNLLPNMLALYAGKDKFEDCRRYHAIACIECGYCSYNCPSKIPIMQLVKYAKAGLGGKT